MESRRRRRFQKLFFWQKDRALYKPLDSKQAFRLLVLHAGSGKDPVRATLRLARLDPDSPSQYETISYCWGDPTKPDKIYLNKKLISVPASSAAAVRCVRLPDRDRIVWIDAICINQADLDERSQQVAMMADIYASSNGNLVYLGEEEEGTAHVVENIRLVLADIVERTENFQNTKDTPFGSHDHRFFYHDVSCNADEKALISFFSNNWFQRLWAFQEAALAPSNICFLGSIRIELLDVVRVAQWLYFQPGSYPAAVAASRGLWCAGELHNLIDKSLGFHYTIIQPSLTRLFEMTKNLLASDPRDHVYGLLGLWTRSGRSITAELRHELSPNYRKPVEDVFRDATRVAFSETDDFQIWKNLSHQRDEELWSSGMPSWVKRLDQQWDYNQEPTPFYHGFAADKGRRHQHSKINFVNQDIISARGIYLGEIIDVTAILATEDTYGVGLRTWTNEAIAKIASHNVENAVPYNKIARTLLAGSGLHGNFVTQDDTLDFASFLRVLEDQHTSIPEFEYCTPAMSSELRAAAKFKTGMRYGSMNRRMLITNTNHIGIGPKLTRPGDVVVILYGGEVPLVLRPFGENYRLVGECYVSNVMRGEAVRKHRDEGDQDIEFRIE